MNLHCTNRYVKSRPGVWQIKGVCTVHIHRSETLCQIASRRLPNQLSVHSDIGNESMPSNGFVRSPAASSCSSL